MPLTFCSLTQRCFRMFGAVDEDDHVVCPVEMIDVICNNELAWIIYETMIRYGDESTTYAICLKESSFYIYAHTIGNTVVFTQLSRFIAGFSDVCNNVPEGLFTAAEK